MDTISAQRAMRVAKSYIDETDDINLTDKVVVRNARTTLSLAVKAARTGVQSRPASHGRHRRHTCGYSLSQSPPIDPRSPHMGSVQSF